MPIPRISYQLRLDLDLPEPENGSEGFSLDDARIKAEAARNALEGMYGKLGAPRWLDEFIELTKGGCAIR